MRLNELKGYKDIKSDIASNQNYIEFLQSKGLKRIGVRSTFGTVWDFGNQSWVLKVFKGDSAYLSYINFCRSHQNNPYLPKIKGSIISIKDDMHGVLLERLKEAFYMQGNVLNDFKMDLLSVLITDLGIDSIEDVHNFQGLLPELTEMSYILYAGKPMSQNQKVLETLELLKSNYSSVHSSHDLVPIAHYLSSRMNHEKLDIQPANFMLRGNQLVLIDPITVRDM